MIQLTAFTKKEFTEIIRTGKFLIMIIIFIIFGIMNPAIAKLTPWLFEMLSDNLAEQGMTITNVEVTALTSWQQFFKNIPTGLVVMVVMICGVLVNEYQRGTLINVLTKGLARWKIIIAKSFMVIVLWSICYWLCYTITYLYNMYFWDNSIAHYLFSSAVCMYLFGIWLISLIILSSTFFDNNSGVLLTTGGAVLVSYLISLVPTISKYLPTQLLSAGNMVYSTSSPSDFTASIIITISLTVIGFVVSIIKFNRKKI